MASQQSSKPGQSVRPVQRPSGWLLVLVPVLCWTGATAQTAPEAADQWGLCPAWPPEQPPETVGPPPDGDTPVDITADWMDGAYDGATLYRGDVLLSQGSRRMQADELRYTPDSGEARLSGDVSFLQNDLALFGETARFQVDEDSGYFEDGEFRLLDRHARGSATRIQRQGPERTLLEDMMYTTCPVGSRAWELHAADMDLDHEEGVGTARHMRLDFMRVPIFYTPWLSFPLDDRRKSGFLFPDFGNSGRQGTEVVLPWYWNIAPNLDMTLTPHYRGKRGTQLGTETRYLTRNTGGTLVADYLPDDKKTGDDRYYYSFKQGARLPADFQLSTNIQEVSDPDYFIDLGGEPGARTHTHLPQTATLSQSTQWYRFQSRFRIFQTIDESIEDNRLPYRELPDMRLDSTLPLGRSPFTLELGNRFTRFEREDSIEADRLHLHPRLTARFGTPGWFIQPSVGAQYTRYDLDNAALDASGENLVFAPGESRTATRSAPIYSLDAGMIFERPFAGSDNLIQTLEPRLFYLNVPFRDQSRLPRFDTREMDFTFASLFMEDRFIGPDRLGDANRVGVALTSGILDTRSGRNLVSGSLGQIHHFEDRQVELAGGPTEPAVRDRSELVGEVQLAPTDEFSARTTVLWDPEDRQTTRSAIQFQYRPDPRKVLNIGYRNRRDRLDQADISFAWPVTDRVRVFGRWNHSLRDEETLDRFAGLEYESCCWAIRLTTRRYIFNREGDADRSFMIQLELKGLGGVGNPVQSLFEEGIMGYGYRDYE